jgi:Spy/CpxP family protein refolding chaperone
MRLGLKWTRGKTLWVAAGLALALTPAANAGDRMRPAGRGALVLRAMDRLDLSATQREQVRAILASHRDEAREALTALIESRRAQLAALRGQPFDEGRIRAAAAAVGAAQADLLVTRARIRSEVRAVLSAGQQARLEQMLEDFRALGSPRRLAGRFAR